MQLTNEELKKTFEGYNGKRYMLYELCKTANNFTKNDPKELRQLLKEKYAKVYNCTAEKVPTNILREIYGLQDDFVEIWKEDPRYSDKKYKVSNLGRIKLNNIIVLQDDNNLDGYLKMTKTDAGNKADNVTDTVYNFIAATFLGDPKGKCIHHINNNGYDNRPENLILLEAEQHSYVHGFSCGNYKD